MKKIITASAIIFLISCTKEVSNNTDPIIKPIQVRVVAISNYTDISFTTVIYAR